MAGRSPPRRSTRRRPPAAARTPPEHRSSQDGKEAPTIALFLPESKTTRYEAFDRPLFEAKVKALCADCKVLYNNADQDAAKQQQQVEAALTQGADILVLDAVDASAVAPLVNQAKQKKIPVIAYDRLISGIGYDVLRLVQQRPGRRDAGPGPARRAQRPGHDRTRARS